MKVMCTLFAGLTAVAPAVGVGADGASTVGSDLLASLEGRWTMVGDVMGKPVRYDMEASPTLQGRFLEIHMNDVQVPSQYEARVFLGMDENGEVIVHWLDSFGPRYSIPHGTGVVTDSTIVFTVPYASGPFRDTLLRDPVHGTWTFSIEAAQTDGTWAHFARYELTRSVGTR